MVTTEPPGVCGESQACSKVWAPTRLPWVLSVYVGQVPREVQSHVHLLHSFFLRPSRPWGVLKQLV